MGHLVRLSRRRRRLAIAIAAGVVTAALAAGALATTFTLRVAKHATVVNFNTGAVTHEKIVVAGVNGHAVYHLTGDSKLHPKCTAKNHCFHFWPPVTVASPNKLSKASGVHGKLSTWHRNGFFQVLLNGHPLYFFFKDKKARVAHGEAIHSFGGTWHVIVIKNGAALNGGY